MRVLVPVCLWASCTPPDATTFTLRLETAFAEGGAVLDLEPEIKLLQILPTGEETVRYVGTAARGTEVDFELPPSLPAGSRIGVIAEARNSRGDLWRPRETLAYGQVTLTEDLASGSSTIPMLIVEVDRITELDSAAPARRRWGGAAAVVPGHGAYLFGGGDPESLLVQSKGILKLAQTDSGDTSFENVGNLPTFPSVDPYGGEGPQLTDRTGMTATVVDHDGQTLILVIGGRADAYASTPDVSGWFLWDPVTDSVASRGTDLSASRSEHLAVRFDNGDVLIYGGFLRGQASALPSYEIWDANTGNFENGTDTFGVQTGRFAAMAAPLGRDVVVCGGVDPLFTLNSDALWQPTAACNRIQPNGTVASFPALPMPLAGAAMSALPDGGLFVSGGYFHPFEENWALGGFYSNEAAVTNTFYYDPTLDTWRGAGHMASARAHHRHVPMVDGRLMIIGGSARGTAIFGAVPDPVRCPEIYDHRGDLFAVTDCSDVGQGAWPVVAWAPGEETLVIEGVWSETFQPWQGGSDYGILGLGPPL